MRLRPALLLTLFLSPVLPFTVLTTAETQQAGKVWRIGVLSRLPAPIYMTPFVEGLRDLGWREGRDFTLESRFSGDTPEEADRAGRETLVTGNAAAAMRATAEIPIVMMVSGYPVEVGLVKSHARPGGTGNSAYAGTQVFGKHVEILKTLLPACDVSRCSGATSRHSSMLARGNWGWAS
jgi:hypothetical protein